MKTATAKVMIFIAGVIIALGLLAIPVKADEGTQEVTCVSVYGGGVVCGETTEEVEVVEAGIEDINFMVVAQLAGMAGALFYLLSQLTKRVYILD
jgi:hypothetical protein